MNLILLVLLLSWKLGVASMKGTILTLLITFSNYNIAEEVKEKNAPAKKELKKIENKVIKKTDQAEKNKIAIQTVLRIKKRDSERKAQLEKSRKIGEKSIKEFEKAEKLRKQKLREVESSALKKETGFEDSTSKMIEELDGLQEIKGTPKETLRGYIREVYDKDGKLLEMTKEGLQKYMPFLETYGDQFFESYLNNYSKRISLKGKDKKIFEEEVLNRSNEGFHNEIDKAYNYEARLRVKLFTALSKDDVFRHRFLQQIIKKNIQTVLKEITEKNKQVNKSKNIEAKNKDNKSAGKVLVDGLQDTSKLVKYLILIIIFLVIVYVKTRK
jgi:hypothetical protein